MSSKYRSPMSTAYRKPIVIYSEDPRAQDKKSLKKYRGTIGSEIIIKTNNIKPIALEEDTP